MNQAEYDAEVERLWGVLETRLSAIDSIVDWDMREGVFTVTFDHQREIVVSRQSYLKEIWLASNTGAFHFQWSQGEWVTRQGKTFFAVFEEIMDREQQSVGEHRRGADERS